MALALGPCLLRSGQAELQTTLLHLPLVRDATRVLLQHGPLIFRHTCWFLRPWLGVYALQLTSGDREHAEAEVWSELLIDADGIAKPAILCHVEELIAVGIEEIVIVVQKEDLGSFESLFHQPDTPENFNRLPPKAQVYARRVLAMGEKVATLAALAPRRLPTL